MAIQELLGANLLTKDGVVNTSERTKDKVVGLYFSAHWCPPCRGFTPKLAETYNTLKKQGKDFEIVFVSSDKDQESFDGYYGDMPWAALPFEDRDQKNALSKKFKVNGIPSLVILDSDGETINANGREAVGNDSEGADFPWRPPTFAEALGDNFVNKSGSVGLDAIAGKTLGIYFSAHWCPPCRGFTPELIKTYNKLKEQGKDFEIIFASSDRDQEAFDDYFGSMPWLAIPHGDKRKEQLSSMFEVESIPTFVIVDPSGKVINVGGRSAVKADPEGAEYPWWPKPVHDSADGPGVINEEPTVVVCMEKLDDEAQAAALDAMSTVAREHGHGSRGEEEARVPYWMCAKSGGGDFESIGDRLRQMTNVGDAVDGKVSMILIDIPDSSYYVSDVDHVSVEVLRDFVAKYKAKELSRKQLS